MNKGVGTLKSLRKMVSMVLAFALVLSAFAAYALELPDGVYTGTGAGMQSNIVVDVTVKDGKITSVDVVSHNETPGISDAAIETIPAAIVEAQSTDVDAVATATFTSNGIKEAVDNALSGEAATVQELTIDPDLIVVGGGMAGIVASVRGAELGLKVLLLEGSARIGGCIHYAGGTISGSNFKIQEENGIEDSPEAFYADVVRLGGGESELNPELSKAHCEKSGAAIDWLDEDIGVDFGSRTLVAGAYAAFDTMRVTLAGDNSGLGGALNYLNPLTDRLNKAIEEGSVQLMLNSTVTELVVKDGKCTGVKVGEVEYSAPTTLLATGGYCHNEELLKMAGFDNIVSQAPKTSNGSGFYLAQAVGGVFDNMDKLATYYGGGLMTDGFEMTYGANTSYPGRIYVDLNGNRVGDETTNDVHLWMNAPEDKLYLLISGNMIDKDTVLLKYGISTRTPLANNGWDMMDELAAEENCVYKAETIEELAEKMGAENLVATVEKYNADVAAGEDTQFGRAADTMVALEEGPFYAVETVPYAYTGSTGGVRVDGNGQLLTEDGVSIEGLYLAGEILGPTCISGNVIFGGINHAMAATWGLNAAENAAKAVE
jgi:hypothetical protein